MQIVILTYILAFLYLQLHSTSYKWILVHGKTFFASVLKVSIVSSLQSFPPCICTYASCGRGRGGGGMIHLLTRITCKQVRIWRSNWLVQTWYMRSSSVLIGWRLPVHVLVWCSSHQIWILTVMFEWKITNSSSEQTLLGSCFVFRFCGQ